MTLTHLVNLAADAAGTFVMYATDDYFAPKEDLLREEPPQYIPDRYTPRGKWMDGWESQRKREPGHDFVILRLGNPGRVHELLVDTTHFKGNAAPAVSLEVAEVAETASVGALLSEATEWREVLPKTPVLADAENTLPLPSPSPRATHVRLHIHPDGGVARLRVMGEAAPDPARFWQPAAIDLAALEHGAVAVAASDAFFSPPSNLLLPGRGCTMREGWETRRRRTPGTDWCVIRLGRPGLVQRLEIDTHLFKGNAPQSVSVEGMDARERSQDWSAGEWRTLLEEMPTVPHRRHVCFPEYQFLVTHLRVHMRPHGGIHRLRAYGEALDTDEERARLEALNAMAPDAAREVFRSFNGSSAWTQAMTDGRPFSCWRHTIAAGEAAWWGLGEADWLEAFGAHPRIGARKPPEEATGQSAAWSTGEQGQVHRAEPTVLERMAELNERYVERFGFIYIVCATGRSAEQLLAILEARVERERARELAAAAAEQARITRLRIQKWVYGTL